MFSKSKNSNLVLASAVALLACSNSLSALALDASDPPSRSVFSSESIKQDQEIQAGTAVSLKGIISDYAGPAPEDLVDDLVSTALERDGMQDRLSEKGKQYKSLMGRATSSGKQLAHLITEYRGFEFSSEAADVILGEKIRAKSTASVDYAQQKRADELHAKIYSSMLQIAQGLGLSDQERRSKSINNGMESLKQIVGFEAAHNTLQNMTSWSEQVVVPAAFYKQQPWDVLEIQTKTENLSKQALQNDSVMSYTRRMLHRYNSHNKFVLASAKMINVSITIAMLSPTVLSPAAQLTSLAYLMATGGPEETKLLQELYLDKRLECRWKRVNQEIGQALQSYNTAVMTKNPVLLAFSESMMSSMAGEAVTSSTLGDKPLISKKSSRDNEISCVQGHGVF